MAYIFSVRLDERTHQKLALLARENHRSRGNMVRWLINTYPEPENEKPSLPSELSESLANFEHRKGEVQS